MNRHWKPVATKIVVLVLAVLVCPSFSRGAQEVFSGGETYILLAQHLGAVVKKAKIGDALVGIDVREAQSGARIYALNPAQPLNPASGIKVLTAFAALACIGPEHRFATAVRADGKSGGEVRNVYLVGGGDPSLETGDLREMARAAAVGGVKTDKGDVVVDDSLFDEESLPPFFDHNPASDADNPFRASVGAASLNANRIEVRVLPPAAGAAKAGIEVFPKGYAGVVNDTSVVKEGKNEIAVSLHGEGKDRKVRVAGKVPASYGGGIFYVRADDPSMLAGHALRQLLEEAGVKVKGGVKRGPAPGSGTALLASHKSESLSAILPHLGKESQNFYAEQLLKMTGAAAQGAPATSAKGIEAVKDILEKAGVDPGGVTLVNGSGLYDANAISAQDMAAFLSYALLTPEYFPEFLSQLAVGGVDGTLAKRFGGGDGLRRVRAKTGTLKGTTSLSGYVLPPPGKKAVAFSIIVNKTAGRTLYFRKLQDEIVETIADFLYGGADASAGSAAGGEGKGKGAGEGKKEEADKAPAGGAGEKGDPAQVPAPPGEE